MFNKAIYGTEFNTEAANRLFSNITEVNSPDQSFLSSLRALLRKRLPSNENLKLVFKTVSFHQHNLARQLDNLISEIYLYYPSEGHNIIIVCVNNSENNAGNELLEFLKTNLGKGTKNLKNFIRRDDLHLFYVRKLKALFFTDDIGKNTIIFARELSLKHFHALQMMIPKYLPNLFSDSSLSETEIAFLKSTGNKSAVEYESLLKELSKGLDFRSETIRIKLAGFETLYERIHMDEIRDLINQYQQDYDSYLQTLRDISRKLQDNRYILAGLESDVSDRSGDSELVEYFMCNKNLTVVLTYKTTLEFIAHGYADIYDEEAFSKYVKNLKGYLYHGINPNITKLQMKKLYLAIFDKRIYKLRICAA